MSKSIWTIVTMGFMAVVIMVFMMLFSLTSYQGTAAGNRARLSNQLREEFGFPEAGAGVKDSEGRLFLKIEYLAHTESKFDDDFMKDEMTRVADFARRRYDGKDRRSISGIRVRRLEVRGRGCWQTTLDRDFADDTPLGAPLPPKPRPDEEPEPPQEDK